MTHQLLSKLSSAFVKSGGTSHSLAFKSKSTLLGLLVIAAGSIGPQQLLAQKKIPAKPASAIKGAAPTVNSPAPEGSNAPAVVATVNGNTITRDQLAQLCLKRCGTDVLESVLNKYLIMQACQAQGIKVTQKDIDEEIARIAGKFSLSTQMYLKLIEDQRDILPEQYAADVVWPMLSLRALARDKVNVTQADIDKAYQAEFGPKVQVRMIAVKDAIRAQDLFKKCKDNPDDFKIIAKKYSEDPSSASVEGLLPPIRRYGADDPIEQKAFALQPNEVSDLFQVGEMYVFLQCVRHVTPPAPSAAQIAELQTNIRKELEDVKLREIADTLFNSLREQSQLVKVFGNPELEKQHPGVAAILNRQNVPIRTLEEECIKRFGPKVLDGAIHRKLIEGALEVAGKVVTQADIDAEIARAADYYGMVNSDGSPNVEAWMNEVLKEDGASRELYFSDVVWPTVALKKLIADKVTVTEEDLDKGFKSNYGPRAEILAVVCSNQRTAQEVWQMARDNPTEQFFGELASQYSVEPSSRSNYGKVPPLRRFSGQPTLEEAAFKLKAGELSGIIESGGQYIILRSQGTTTPVVTDINAVRGELTKDILEKKQRVAMEKYLDTIIKAAQIDNFLVPKSQLGTAATQATLKAMKEDVGQTR